MPPEPVIPWPLDWSRLAATRFAGVRCFDEIDSTNAYLLAEAAAGAPEGLVAVADVQHAGRGRLGRTWSARGGSALLVSVLLRPAVSVEQAPLVLMAVGLAAADGVEEAAGFRPRLKWPNDLVAPGGAAGSSGARAKLAGILAEWSGGALVVGVGVNVRADSYPPELASTATSCEEQAGRAVDRAHLLVTFLEALEQRYAGLLTGGAAGILSAYRAATATLGRRVRVELAGGAVEGTAVDLGPFGALIVAGDDGRRTTVHAGDVIHLRPAGHDEKTQ